MTHTKPIADGMTILHILSRYLSENPKMRLVLMQDDLQGTYIRKEERRDTQRRKEVQKELVRYQP